MIGSQKLWIWAFVLAVIAYSPALYEWEKSGWGDWQQFHHWWEVGRISITRWHEWPLWDPHHCGGVSMWGQPQSQHNAPTWWITGLVFGTVLGHKLFIILHGAVGFVGMFLVARRLHHFAHPAAALTALVWAFSGFFAWRGAGGHSTFLAFHYLPWIYLFWRKTNDDLRYAGGVAALMGLTLAEGGTYPFPLMFLLLLYDFVIQLASPRSSWRVLRTGLVTGALTLLIGASRLWPIYLTMSRFPRETAMEDTQTLNDLLESLTAREPHDWHFGHRWVWAEYGSYLGYAVLGLAAMGALFALATKRVKRRHLIAGVVVFAACSMGNAGEHWPWPLLHELPVFENFHVPSRFHVLMTFYIALLAGLFVDRALRVTTRRTKRRAARRALVVIAWIVFLGVGADVMSNSIHIAARWDGSPLIGTPGARFHLVSPAGYLQQYMHYPARNVGTPACYDPVPWNISRALWIGDMPQIRIQPPTAGEVTGESRTNHTLHGEVVLREPARVVFNQNFDPDWTVGAGTLIEDLGRLAIDLPAGTHSIDARFEPRDLPWSVLATLLGLVLSLLMWWGFRPRLDSADPGR